MNRRFNFLCFALALFLIHDVSEGQWMDYLCRNKENIELHYNDSALVLLPADFRDHQNSTWKYRKLCLYNEDEEGKCIEIGVIMNGTEYPKSLRIHPDTTSNDLSAPEKSRNRRASKNDARADLPNDFFYDESTCNVASHLKTAEILCKIFPSSIKCNSHCVYGTTFDEGIKRTHTCSFKENRWSRDFEECRPFVDCNLKLISPGNLKCIGNEVLKSPRCQVDCDEYEDKDETKSQLYSCLSNGKWEPPLPHCVAPKGIDLARAPSITEHAAITYP